MEEIYTNTKYFSEDKDLSQHRAYYVFVMNTLSEIDYDLTIVHRSDSIWRRKSLKKNIEQLYEMTKNPFCQIFLSEQNIKNSIIELYKYIIKDIEKF